MNKYFLFRDLDNSSNLCSGLSYHAAGLVIKDHRENLIGSVSGKDLAVKFFDPFEAIIYYTWRAIEDVELFEISGVEYLILLDRYNQIDKVQFR